MAPISGSHIFSYTYVGSHKPHPREHPPRWTSSQFVTMEVSFEYLAPGRYCLLRLFYWARNIVRLSRRLIYDQLTGKAEEIRWTPTADWSSCCDVLTLPVAEISWLFAAVTLTRARHPLSVVWLHPRPGGIRGLICSGLTLPPRGRLISV